MFSRMVDTVDAVNFLSSATYLGTSRLNFLFGDRVYMADTIGT